MDLGHHYYTLEDYNILFEIINKQILLFIYMFYISLYSEKVQQKKTVKKMMVGIFRI
jgi:hypothetical protein